VPPGLVPGSPVAVSGLVPGSPVAGFDSWELPGAGLVARGWVVVAGGAEGDAPREPEPEGPDDPDWAPAAPAVAVSISTAIEAASSLDTVTSQAVSADRMRSIVNGTDIEWFLPVALKLGLAQGRRRLRARLVQPSSRQNAPSTMAAMKPNESAMSTQSQTVAASMRVRAH
jgi:hypothetical protein